MGLKNKDIGIERQASGQTYVLRLRGRGSSSGDATHGLTWPRVGQAA